MAGFTNRGKYLILDGFFRGATLPTNFYVALCLASTAPTADTNTLGDLDQIAVGNGYTDGGYQLDPNGTDFDSLTEDDATNDNAVLQILDVAWTASAGSIPSSGLGARYAVLTDDAGGATMANNQVIAYWDLTSERSVSSGQTLTLQNLQLEANES